MGKFDGVMLISDFDDTLCSTDLTGTGPNPFELGLVPLLSEGNRKALDYFIAEGGIFTIATGRAHRTFARFAGELPLGAPAILSNGAVIYDFKQNKDIIHGYLRPQVVKDMKAVSTSIPEVGFETQFDHTVCIYHPNEYTWRHLKRLALDYESCTLEEMPQPWSKLVLQGTRQVLEKTQAFISDRWPEAYEPIFSNNNLLEITPKGYHKGSMCRVLAESMHIALEHLYCVGDNQNDIGMLEASAIPFAPEGCAQVVRDFGARIMRSCKDDCIAHVIEVLDELYPTK